MLNRRARARTRLRFGLALAAGMGAMTPSAAAPGEVAGASPAWRQGLAVQLYSFHRDLEHDLPGTLRRIKALGFDRVETYPVTGTTAAQLRAALDAAGLVAVSAHMPWDRIKTDMAGVIADVRTVGAEQFGPGSINLFDGKPFRTMSLAEAREAGRHLGRACRAAQAANLRVFVHTHGNEVAPVGETRPLDAMLREAGQCFDIQADLTWIKWAGTEPASFIERYGRRVRSLHLKDIAAAAVGREFGRIDKASFAVAGKGSIEWAAVLRAARAAGVRHYIVEDESADPTRQIPQSLQYLDGLTASLGATGQSVDAPMPPPSAAPTFADEFDGRRIDSAKWRFDTSRNSAGWYNNERQYYSAGRAENARLDKGALVIEARREALSKALFPDWGGQAYTSARLVSRRAYGYGYYEIRAKLPCGRGIWPAIWLLPADGKWPDAGEIDIMEMVGWDPNVVHATLHSGAFNHSKGTQRGAQKRVPTSCTAFHRYQLDWRPDAITIGIDGRAHMRVANDQPGGAAAWPFTRPYQLILNVAVGGDWAGQKGIDDGAFPQRMTIDYVRYWAPGRSGRR